MLHAVLLAVLLGTPVAVTPLRGQAWGIAAGCRLNWGGPGSRAGDIQGYGFSVRRSLAGSLSPRWEAALSVDRFEYDLETPVHATAVRPRPGDSPVDAFTTVTRGQVDLIRRFRSGGRWAPFVTAGAGIYVIDVPDVSGNTEDGGTFQLRTESPTTAGVTVGAGSEWRVYGRTSIGLGLSYSQTIAKYRVTEERSGATGTISPFAPLGAGAQVIYRW